MATSDDSGIISQLVGRYAAYVGAEEPELYQEQIDQLDERDLYELAGKVLDLLRRDALLERERSGR